MEVHSPPVSPRGRHGSDGRGSRETDGTYALGMTAISGNGGSSGVPQGDWSGDSASRGIKSGNSVPRGAPTVPSVLSGRGMVVDFTIGTSLHWRTTKEGALIKIRRPFWPGNALISRSRGFSSF